MKNAMKRIMSILLVALLLVSALPLAASADVVFDDDNTDNDIIITNDAGNGNDGIMLTGMDDEISAFNVETDKQGLYIQVVSVPYTSNTNTPEWSAVLINAWNWHEGNDQPKSATVAQMLAKCDQDILKDYTFYNASYGDGSNVQWSTSATYEQDKHDEDLIIIRMIPKVKMDVVITYKQVKSEEQVGTTVTLRNRSSVSYQDVRNNIPTGTNLKLSLDRVYVENSTPANDEIKSGNTYDLKEIYAAGHLTTRITAYVNTSEFVENEKPNPDEPTVDSTPGNTTTQKATVIFTIDDGSAVTKYATLGTDGATVGQLLDASAAGFGYSKTAFRNMFVEAYKGSTALYLNQGRVFNGETVRIYLSTKSGDNGNDNDYVGGSDGNVVGNDLYMAYSGTTNKDPNPVVLYVFTKNSGNGITFSESFNITSLASDDKTSLTEIRNYLKGYYTATNDDGISVDGIYEYVYNFNSSWANDTNKYENIYNLNKARQDGRVELAVVLYNAKLKSSSVADSSNPKTGDSIFAPIAVLGASTAALATAMFVYNKKRVAR